MKYRFEKALAATAATAAAFLVTVPTASADADSFIDYMRDHGQMIFPPYESEWIAGGYMLCDRLRDGMAPEQVQRLVIPMMGRDPATYLFAAQHELCPETLA